MGMGFSVKMARVYADAYVRLTSFSFGISFGWLEGVG